MPENPRRRPTVSMSRELRWAADLLGATCFLNAAWEGLSQGAWHSFTGIYSCYYMVLSAYAALREGEKWTAHEKLEERMTGEIFVCAWAALAAFLWAWDALIYPICWPPDFYLTFKWVLAVFALSKGSAGLRASGLIGSGWAPPDPVFPPSPGGGQGGDPTPSDPPDPQPRDGRGASALVKQTLLEAGGRPLSAQDIATKSGLSLGQVNHALGPMVRDKLASKTPDDRFIWIGG
ncbi:MAG: hypothetical protein ACYCPQ_01610 [Elusimicrobiota bacterium]